LTDDGLPTPFGRASMESDEFSNNILIAHQERGLLSFKCKSLGHFSNGGKLEDMASLSNLSPFSNDHMGSDLCPLPNDHNLFNHRIRTNFNVLTDLCLWVDD